MTTNRTILLAYASRYGSTQEVAEAVAAELREGGLEVESRPAREVVTLERYDAIVLGAAIYDAKWHAEAHQFLSRHQETLRRKPLAIFSLGPLSTSDAAMKRSRLQLEKELAQYPWLKPVELEMFVGKIDPSKLSFIYRLASSASDKRDWHAIQTWARSLAVQLRRTLPQPTAA